MKESELSKKVLSGMKWKTIERFFLQFINAVTPMVLARLLMPEDFGAIAILSVFISIANTFVNNGLTNSIIQKKDSDELDCSTVFYVQLAISIVCYLILFAFAPLIASLYENVELSPMLRVMALSLIIGALGSMQMTVMKKKMEFEKSFVIFGAAAVAQGVVGIGLAYLGFGCWSLVWANIANSIVLRLTAVLMVKWYPVRRFSFSRLKTLFSYSWKLTVGWLVGTLHQDLYVLVIGKMFSPTTLGYYNRAGSFPQIISKTVTEVVDGVMFPAMSQIQDDREKLKEITKNLLSLNSYILFPVFFGLSAVAKNLVTLILTEKWNQTAPMMSIICVTYALNAINNSNMQVFNAMGRSDIFMKFELIKRSISIVLLIIMSFINIYAVILVLLLMAVLSNIMNAYQNRKLLGIAYTEQVMCYLPPLAGAIMMWVIVVLVGTIRMNKVLSLLCQIVCGALVYVLLSVVFKPAPFRVILRTVINKKSEDKI